MIFKLIVGQRYRTIDGFQSNKIGYKVILLNNIHFVAYSERERSIF